MNLNSLRPRLSSSLRLEYLEDRTTPTTFTVTTQADSGAGSLRAEVSLALSTPGSNIIDFAPFGSSLSGNTIDLTTIGDTSIGPTALPLITNNLTIAGSGQLITLGSAPAMRLFAVGPTGTLTLEDVTLAGGIAQGGAGGAGEGGGAAGLGGAIYNQGTLDIFDSTLTGNQAIGGSNNATTVFGGGGGLGGPADASGDGGAPNGGSPSSSGGFGGGGGDASGNGGFGGGGGVGTGSNGGFGGSVGGTGGFGGGGGGGGYGNNGVNAGPGGSGGFGGGAGSSGTTSPPLPITGAYGNGGGGAGVGGAIFNQGGTINIGNSTLASNTAAGGIVSGGTNGSGYGSALFNLDGAVTLTNDTISGNTNTGGTTGNATAALFNLSMTITAPPTLSASATIDIGNTIVANTTGGTGNIDFANDQLNGVATINATGPNIVPNAFALTGTFTGPAFTTTPPKLGPLQANGGQTENFLPMTGSPAIGTGSTAVLTASNFGGAVPTTDQRGSGFARTINGNVDIGATEVQSIVISPTGGGTIQFSPYSQMLTASGGTGPYTFSASGAPQGIAVSSTGTLSGTPQTNGEFTFDITVTDSLGETSTDLYTLIVVTPIVIAPTTLPAATQFVTYTQNLTASGGTVSGGTGPYTYAISSGALPSGFTLSSAGTLSGTPQSTGQFTFTVAASSMGYSGSHQFTLSIKAPTPLLVSGQLDGTVAVYSLGVGGQYSLSATLQPFGNIPVDVRTAVGDINGDGIPDYIFATGPGTTFEVTVLSGASGNPVLVVPFDPFLPNPGGSPFTAGGFVSAGDFLANGRDQFVVSPDQQGGPRIAIYDKNGAATAGPQPATPGGVNTTEINPGSGLTRINNFLSVNADFRGGARTAVGDLNGDGIPDLAIAAGFGGGPVVLVINGTKVTTTDGFTNSDDLIANFFAFDSTLRDGAYLAIGDVLGNGQQDLILGPGAGGPAEVEVLGGQQVIDVGPNAAIASPVANFVPTSLGGNGAGVRVAAIPSGVGDQVNVAVGTGRNIAGLAKVYPGTSFANGSISEPNGGQLLTPFGGSVLTDGIFVG